MPNSWSLSMELLHALALISFLYCACWVIVYLSCDSKLCRSRSKTSTMSNTYDYIVVGGGPAGIAFSQCCAKVGKQVAVIEAQSSLGGCHRVKRVNGLFTEHGPRVYSSTYQTFASLLADVGLSFEQMFTPYNFTISNIGGGALSNFTTREILLLVNAYVWYMIRPSHAESESVQSYMLKNEFTAKAIDYANRLCLLTDGAGADRYSLYEFFSLVNEQGLNTLYQPIRPNDVGLFTDWPTRINSHMHCATEENISGPTASSKVTFLTSTRVTSILTSVSCNTVNGVQVQKPDGSSALLQSKTVILAMPPTQIQSLICHQPNVSDAFGPALAFQQYCTSSNYVTYIPITFHWGQKLDLPSVYGFPATSWGVCYIELSNYMSFDDPRSVTVLSTAISMVNSPSDATGKTANQTLSTDELVNEVYRQLKQSFPSLPFPGHTVVSPDVYRSGDVGQAPGQWMNSDTAFIKAAGVTDLPFASNTVPGLYNVGCHNGKSAYSFTSLEGAVSNAVVLAKQLEPSVPYVVKQFMTISNSFGTLKFFESVVNLLKGSTSTTTS